MIDIAFLETGVGQSLGWSGTSFAHLFSGVCWFSVMPSEGVNTATPPAELDVTVV